MDNENYISQKSQIFFSRSYRHLYYDKKWRLLFLFCVVAPCVIVYLFYYTEISYLLAFRVKEILFSLTQDSLVSLTKGEFLPKLNGVYFVELPSKIPSLFELYVNLILTITLLVIFNIPFKKRTIIKPLSIYFTVILLIHLTSVIYFMFSKGNFPYTATVYSELYMKQQIGIWLSFFIIAGIVIGILGYGSIIRRITFYGLIMIYSFIFGSTRYLISMYIISNASSLYMATLFFSLGPLIDYIYLICFYGIYVNKMIDSLSEGEGRMEWHWL